MAADRETLTRWFANGLSAEDAAERDGCSVGYVQQRARKWGLETVEQAAKRRARETLVELVSDQYVQGRTITSLAIEHHTSYDGVSALLNLGFVQRGAVAVRSRAHPDQVRTGLAAGLTLPEIATQLRCSVELVARAAAQPAHHNPPP